jgi:hypothetical protein
MYSEIADIVAASWMLPGWGLLVGLVFSTVGAAGGILASVCRMPIWSSRWRGR